MDLNKLTDITFVKADKEEVVKYLLATYKSVTGRTLAQADPVRLFILVMASVIIMLLNKINYTGKQNLLRYATGDNLDHIGALVGVGRTQPAPARTTIRFTLSESRNNAVVIPEGTRVSSGGNVYFKIERPLTILQGKTSGEVEAVCTEVGTMGNDMLAGEITTLVDALPYVKSVVNITKTEGGALLEDDGSFRERIQTAPEAFSCAGAIGAYQFFAKKASALIEDVAVISPTPGKIVIYPLLKEGKIPEQEILNAVLTSCNDKSVRPLTDHVSTKAPAQTTYNINVSYYIHEEDASLASIIQKDVEAAIDAFVIWQRSAMGRDINPSELTRRIMDAGAKRVVVTSPMYTKVKNGSKADNYVVEIATLGSRKVVYGGLEDE